MFTWALSTLQNIKGDVGFMCLHCGVGGEKAFQHILSGGVSDMSQSVVSKENCS